MADRIAGASFAALWSAVHEGGIIVETYVTPAPTGDPALRTVLQLDGDRTLSVNLAAITSLSNGERLRLAVRHRAQLRAKSRVVLTTLQQAARLIHSGLLCLAAASELLVLVAKLLAYTDWSGLLSAQLGPVTTLALRWLWPHLLRGINVAARWKLQSARNTVALAVYDRLVRGDKILE